MRPFCSLLLAFAALLAGPTLLASSKQRNGSICLGPDLSNLHSVGGHLYLSVGKSKVRHPLGQGARVVVTGMDTHREYRVHAWTEDSLVESWNVNFLKARSGMLDVWRDSGGWKTEPNRTGRCSWPRD